MTATVYPYLSSVSIGDKVQGIRPKASWKRCTYKAEMVGCKLSSITWLTCSSYQEQLSAVETLLQCPWLVSGPLV